VPETARATDRHRTTEAPRGQSKDSGMNGLSYLDIKIRETVNRVFDEATAEGGWLRELIRKHVAWHMQGFEPGYSFADRERFTESVAERIQEKGVRRRVRLFGLKLWDVRYSIEWCRGYANGLVTEWLKDERIKFGDQRFYWDDGKDIADEDLDHWEPA
jgi:hypothetical protein